MGKKLTLVEVGPRDGFQNIKEYIPVETKLAVIDSLVDAGVKHMQITSFVHPKAIPQLRDAAQVAETCLKKYPDLDLFALIPNYKGAENARNIGIKKVTNVISLSETHNKANINRTRDESLAELEKIFKDFSKDMEICLDVATTFGCPFEGKYYDVEPLLAFLKRGYEIGIRSFDLCDTVGLADPKQVREFVKATRETFPDAHVEVHIHDTRGMGLVNTLAAVEAGVDGVQSTLGGLGGCPFAPGASGNTATEDLVLMFNEMGYDTGIDFQKILAAAKKEHDVIQGNYSGHNIMIQSDTGKCVPPQQHNG